MRVDTTCSDLKELYGRGFAYVDKTDFLKTWWSHGKRVSIFTRPRRFGKTLTLSMIHYFFSPLHKGVTKRDGTPLFEGLKVWEDGEMRAMQGTVPVLSMSFSGAKSISATNMHSLFSSQVRRQFRNYKNVLLKSDLLSGDDKERIRDYANRVVLESPEDAFLDLCGVLQDVYGIAPILLLDEYDTPLTEAFLKGKLAEVIDPMRSFLVQCLKDNRYFSRCLIAGITRIAQPSLFSDFNNPYIDSMLNSNYPALMGYTEEEVCSLLKQAGKENSMADVKRMYDGYSISGQADIYNPYTVNRYIEQKELIGYWIDSSSSALPKEIMIRGEADIKEAAANLLGGSEVWTELPTNLVYEELYHRKEAAFSLLFSSGYLKVVDQRREEDVLLYQVKIPNQEVTNYFHNVVTDWIDSRIKGAEEKGFQYIQGFCRALISGDKDAMTQILGTLMKSFMGESDGAKNPRIPPENFYHALVLGIVANLMGTYLIRSNIPSGPGRYDLCLIPKLGRPLTKKDMAFCLEFKGKEKEEKSLAQTVQRARKQIREKDYIRSIADAGIPEEQIRCYGFGFHGKEVLVGDELSGEEAEEAGPAPEKKESVGKKTGRRKPVSLIRKQPEDASGRKGEVLVLEVEGTGEDISYQWMYQEAGESFWKCSRMKGSKTARLQVTGNAANAKKIFRCRLTDRAGRTEDSKEVHVVLTKE